MRTLGLTIPSMLLAVFGLATASSAQCTLDIVAELHALDVNGGDVEVGDVIEYTVSLQVPRGTGDPPNCTLYNASVYFFAPPLGNPDPCGDCTAGTLVNPTPVPVEPGARPFEWTSATQSALRYIVQPEDAGTTLHADACVRFTAELVPPPPPQDPFWRCQSFSSALDVAFNEPCLRVHKDVDCNKSKEGDEVVYTICVVNCGDIPLYDLEVVDALFDLTGMFPTTLAIGDSLCVDVPYMIPDGAPDPLVNEVTAIAADETGFVVSDTDVAEVDLVHPGLSLDKTCLTPLVHAGEEAEFEIVIENTGDCNLIIGTNEPEMDGPRPLLPGEPWVTRILRDGPIQDCGGYVGIYNDIRAYWTLPPEEYPCVMTNTDSLWAEACCRVVAPCLRVHKDVDCGISKEGDEVVYTVCVVNCGDTELESLSVVDTTLDLTGLFPTTLAVGESLCVDAPYTIPAGAPDPLVNEVTATAYDVAGGAWTDTDFAEVDLIHPSAEVSVYTTGMIEPGGNAEFEVDISNTGDCDLTITTDAPEIAGPFLLPEGETFVTTVLRSSPGGDEEVCFDIHVTWTLPSEYCGMSNSETLYAEACYSPFCVIEVTKEVDCGFSKEGDEVVYTVCVVNCGEVPLYDLEVTDTLLDLTGLFPSMLGVGDSLCVDVPYTIPVGAPDPLINEVTATVYDVGGGSWSETDTAEVDLIHPSAAVTVSCLTDPVPSGGVAEFEVVISNSGDCDLLINTTPTVIPPGSTVPPGEALTAVTTVPDPGGVNEICFDIDVVWTLPPEYCEMTNTDTLSAQACCPVAGEEGCEAGFWKVHPECWCEGHGTADLVGSVFVVPSELSDLADDTLLDVFYYHGGGDVAGAARMLLRAGVAAMLNACDEDISYPMSEAAVVDAVSAALGTLDRQELLELRTTLQMYNSYGCPLNGHCQPIGVPVGPRGPQLVSEDAADVGGLPQGKDVADLGSEGAAVLRSAPNPFHDAARIRFQLPAGGTVAIDIYDAAGRHVVSLMHDAKPAGRHEVVWDGRNAAGVEVPTGVYFCKARLDDETLTEKMILVR